MRELRDGKDFQPTPDDEEDDDDVAVDNGGDVEDMEVEQERENVDENVEEVGEFAEHIKGEKVEEPKIEGVTEEPKRGGVVRNEGVEDKPGDGKSL